MITNFNIFENLAWNEKWFANVVEIDSVEDEYNRIKKYDVEDFHFFLDRNKEKYIIILIYTNNENKHYNFSEYVEEDWNMFNTDIKREGGKEITDIETWIAVQKYNL